MNKYLVVGLGNPGKEYHQTRHNVGFQLLDYFAAQVKATWSGDRFGLKTDLKVKGRSITLLKPDTYMNLSGKAVQFWLTKLNIESTHGLVLLDDLNIPFGSLRMRKNGSAGGHNGLKNIEETILTKEYPRLRIGIGNNYPKGTQVNYVLGEWDNTEKKELENLFNKCVNGILTWVLSGPDLAMNELNTKAAK